MKKILLSILVGISLFTQNTSYAQTGCNGGANNCDLAVGNVVVQVISATPLSASKCEVVFNVAFDLSYNSGNKDVFIHSWLNADYPSYFPCTPGSEPTPGTTQLGTAIDEATKSFLDIGLNNNIARGATGVPVSVPIYTTYADFPSVVLTSPSNSPGMTCTKTFTGTGIIDRFEIKNAKVIINASCASTIYVRTDVWSRNGTNGPAQCWIAGIGQYFNDPRITGFKNCNNPRQYTVGLTTVDPTSKTITYKVYLDVNGNGSLEAGGPDVLAFTSGPINISSSSSYSSGLVSLPPPYSNTKPFSEYNYLILVEGATLSNSVLQALPDPGCIPLPVDFKSFTATRSRSNVMLKWETSSEKNNSGFAVERSLDNATWQEIAFVPTQATGGNSSTDLSYQYIDLNNSKGVTQYRIKQVDIDSRSKYSEIRSVKGDGQMGNIIVYPNPTADGRINVVFDDANTIREIAVVDMSGRTVKQIRGISNNNVTIENLQPGMYSLRVFVPGTGEQTVQKIVVNKR